MQELHGDLWRLAARDGADAVVITTNGFRKSSTGECVMGRGCALEAKQRWPNLPGRLGEYLGLYGNRCFRFHGLPGLNADLVAFPVKPEFAPDGKPGFSAKAELPLIRASAVQLVEMAAKFSWTKVYCPKFGCGYGQLSWEKVKAELAELLDDRFTIISP
jgi:hypothetical protein